MEVDKETFARRIRQLREARGWSREQFGELVGVSYHQVVKWELGRQMTTAKRLGEIYRALGVTPEEFWNEGPPQGLFSKEVNRHIEVDERQRAIRCPRCGSKESISSKDNDDAMFCYSCAFPMYNICSSPDKHINPAHARFCGQCGAKVVWAMNDEELEEVGIPPL